MSQPLARNALANVLQTIGTTGLLFALYRYINNTLGVEQLGVWSVVLAAASASRLADMGLSAGVVRFVARDRARGNTNRAGEVVDTTVVTLAVAIGVLLPLAYPLLLRLMPHLFQGAYLTQAVAILPYALVSLWLTSIAAVFQGGLDGCQHMGLRSGLVIGGQAIMIALAIWVVPRYGLVGLAWAQIGQGIFLVLGGRLLLRHVLPVLPLLPWRWRKVVLREMLGYGANLQVTNIFVFLLDPIANALMARFGGPAAAGYFTMAKQVVLKARSVIVSANQAIVPHVAAIHETTPEYVQNVYRENMNILVLTVLPSFALLFAWAGGISWLLTGAYNSEMVFLIGILTIGWGSNIFCGPAYFINMGNGKVGWNTLSHVVTGVLNVCLGWAMGNAYGAHGVVFAYITSLLVGSIVLIMVFQHKNKLLWPKRISLEQMGLVLSCVLVIAFGWIVPLRPSQTDPLYSALIVALPLLLLGLVFWLHPIRASLVRRLFTQ